MNNGLLTERALLGVFNTTSYINFGTADDPLPYPTVDGMCLELHCCFGCFVRL
jgi:hypothetical protein